MATILKTPPSPDYPPEEGCYLRGNDYSPVAVVVILKWKREETPPDIENLVRVAVESGAALAGTLQTENIGLEKVICNIVANPNIRYLVVFGPESPGRLVGEAVLALAKNGVDERKRIIGTEAVTPYLFNIPLEKIDRFREQVTVIDLVNEGSPDTLREVVAACYQEEPTAFREWMLCDPGAFPEPPLPGGITWRVTDPHKEPKDEKQRADRDRLRNLMDQVKKSQQRKKTGGTVNAEVDVPKTANVRAVVDVDAGACGFHSTIQAGSDDGLFVQFEIQSECDKIRGLGDALMAVSPINAYEEISPVGNSVIMATARECLKGCCAGCAVPVGMYKAMQVAAGLALPKDITIKITARQSRNQI